jgi:hypothetical protein
MDARFDELVQSGIPAHGASKNTALFKGTLVPDSYYLGTIFFLLAHF